MSKFYAVKVGKQPGIYLDWASCSAQVTGFSGAIFKSFSTRAQALDFIGATVVRSPKMDPLPRYEEPDDEIEVSSTVTKIKRSDIPLIAYTDGACPNNGRATRAGIGVYFPNEAYEDLSEPLPEPPYTNNRAEIYAVIRALQTTQGPIIIRTDSMQVINTMTVWLKSRLRSNWDCLNADLYRELYNLSQDREVKYEYIKGHSGDIGNENADRLARAGAE